MESKIVIARGLGKGVGKLLFNRNKVSVWKDNKSSGDE